MQRKSNLWSKLFHGFHKESDENTEGFLDWLVQMRLDYFAHNGTVTAEEDLTALLTASLDKELTASEKTALALFVDRVEHEKQVIYKEGVLDGILLMKAIHKIS